MLDNGRCPIWPFADGPSLSPASLQGASTVSLFFGIFAALISLARVYLGLHYPSDVVAGALLGILTSAAINHDAVRQQIAKHVLALEPRYPPCFYSLLFIVLAEVSAAFPNRPFLAAAG